MASAIPQLKEQPGPSRQSADRVREILIVDDHPANRDLLRIMLQAADCDTAEACDGQEAVNAASAEAFDLILMDVRMPVMDGLAATRAIRALPGTAALPIGLDPARTPAVGSYGQNTVPAELFSDWYSLPARSADRPLVSFAASGAISSVGPTGKKEYGQPVTLDHVPPDRTLLEVLREDLARDPAFVRRFESEALAAARLNHPGIVSVFDVGEEQPDARGGLPRPFIVMEKVTGSTLRTVRASSTTRSRSAPVISSPEPRRSAVPSIPCWIR